MHLRLLSILFLLSLNLSAQSSRSTKWFEEARFGMFIHWGLYSAAEGMWKGEKLRYLNNYAEWIRYRNRISKEEYGELAKRFDWETINPEEWVLLAKKAGMKYIIMTSKHHDGVAIWDTKVGTYSLSKLAGVDRDVIKELAEACRKHGMKLGFYYSHWIDWEHPYAWDHNQELIGHVTDEQYNQYWKEKVIPQLTELLTNYGDIALMWFDMWIPYQESIIKKQQLEQVVTLIRKLQPNCLINSRLGLPTDAQNVDFQTLGDNTFGTSYIDHPWETPGTIAHSWGYNGQEDEWKSTSQIFKSLISNVSLNGGLTLNIGPRANGKIPYESITRLTEIGNWLNENGYSVYGAKGLALHSNQFDWGYLTSKKDNNSSQIFAQVFNWPLDNTLRITGISSSPKEMYYKIGNQKHSLSFRQIGPILHIDLPKHQIDNFVSTLTLDFERDPHLPYDLVAESTFGGFSLQAYNTLNKKNLNIIPYDGKLPLHILSKGEYVEWKVYFPEAGKYQVDISSHNPNKSIVDIELKIGDTLLQSKLSPNQKMVVEPNENNYTEEFVNTIIGDVTIKEPTELTVKFKVKDSQLLWLNRIWIKKK